MSIVLTKGQLSQPNVSRTILSRISLLIVTVLLLASCKTVIQTVMTPMERMADAGDYNGIIGAAAQAEQSRALEPQEALFYCESYFHLRRYTEFFDCNEKYEPVLFTYYKSRLLAQEAIAHIDLGDIERAVGTGEDGRRMGRRGESDWPWEYNAKAIYLDTLGPLALAYAFDGQRENALALVEELAANIDDFYATGVGYGVDAGQTYIALGDYEAALKVLRGTERTSFAFDQEELPRQVMLAKAEIETGLVDDGYNRLLSLLDTSFLREPTGLRRTVLSELGAIELRRGNLEKAIQYLLEAIEITEAQRSTIQDERSKIGFAGDKQSAYFDLVQAFLSSGDVVRAFEFAERAKARALVDVLAERQEFRVAASASFDEDIVATLDRLEQQSIQLASLNAADASTRHREASDLRERLRAQAPELASLVTASAVDTATIQSLLSASEVLLEYYGSQDQLNVFVVTRDRIESVSLGTGRWGNRVRRLREALQAYNTDRYKAVTRDVYDRLIRPVESKISQYQQITIVPHGPLHYLPFAALNDGTDYLIDKFDIRLLPSASVVQFLDKKRSASQDLLAFGNPDLGNPDYDLPGAEEETRVINQNRADTRILLRGLASEANFKKFASSFRYLHLASHGEFNSQQPLQSRMLLAAGDGEDGNLTVDELYGLSLNAEMVTLSACETGLGDVENGDEVIGLTRGFLFAGAKSIVSSLWPVSDESTAFLMKRFYENLETMSKAHALRQALISTKKEYPHPLFWSAFNITGAV